MENYNVHVCVCERVRACVCVCVCCPAYRGRSEREIIFFSSLCTVIRGEMNLLCVFVDIEKNGGR